jgi:hypothetical protein
VYIAEAQPHLPAIAEEDRISSLRPPVISRPALEMMLLQPNNTVLRNFGNECSTVKIEISKAERRINLMA